MKITSYESTTRFAYLYGSFLFDLLHDPTQENIIEDPAIEKEMITHLIDLMKKNDAPKEQYERLNIPFDGKISNAHLNLGEVRDGLKDAIGGTEIVWKNKGKSAFSILFGFTPKSMKKPLMESLEKKIINENLHEIDEDFLFDFMDKLWPEKYRFYYDFMKELIKEKAL